MFRIQDKGVFGTLASFAAWFAVLASAVAFFAPAESWARSHVFEATVLGAACGLCVGSAFLLVTALASRRAAWFTTVGLILGGKPIGAGLASLGLGWTEMIGAALAAAAVLLVAAVVVRRRTAASTSTSPPLARDELDSSS